MSTCLTLLLSLLDGSLLGLVFAPSLLDTIQKVPRVLTDIGVSLSTLKSKQSLIALPGCPTVNERRELGSRSHTV